MSHGGEEHWNTLYATTAVDEVSWFQASPETSLRLISSVASPGSAIIDVGAGTSLLADALLDAGWSDLTVLDVSTGALDVVTRRLGERRNHVSFIGADVLSWHPRRSYRVWHDRAVFHFLANPQDQQRYVATATNAVEPEGAVVIGTFAADGPTRCSGLPTARYTGDELAAAFAPAFRPIHSEREEHVTPSRVVQPFTWVVFRRT